MFAHGCDFDKTMDDPPKATIGSLQVVADFWMLDERVDIRCSRGVDPTLAPFCCGKHLVSCIRD